MKNKLLKKIRTENGVVIVEATLVFPVVFFVLFFLIFFGSAMYEKAKVDSYVMKKAVLGAQCVTDPYQYDMYVTGNIPTEYTNVEPYRYFIGGMGDIEDKISKDVKKYFADTSSTFFVDMAPKITSSKGKIANFNNHLLYSTFSVEVSYSVKFPINFLGDNTPTILKCNSRAEVSVNDTPEFIRNIDMIEDIFGESKEVKMIKSAFDKINTFIGKFS